MPRTPRAVALAAVLFVGVAPTLAAQTTVTTEPQATGVINFSDPSATGLTFFQTFMTPNAVDVVLESFRIARTAFQPVSFTPRVFAWLGNRAGAVIWEGATESLAAQTTLPLTYETFTIGRELTAGTTYAFALSFAGPTSVSSGNLRTYTSGGQATPNPYPNGNYFYEQSNSVAALQTAGGLFSGGTVDLGFTATFAPTAAPEPASLALVGTGLLGLVGAVRRRRVAA